MSRRINVRLPFVGCLLMVLALLSAHPALGQMMPGGNLDGHIVWTWGPTAVQYPGFTDVWSAPTVARIFDTNGDGIVDQNDDPSIIFISGNDILATGLGTNCQGAGTSPTACHTGALRVLDGRTGAEQFSLDRVSAISAGFAGISVAVGDVIGNGTVQIAAVTAEGFVVLIGRNPGPLGAPLAVLRTSDKPIPGASNPVFGWGGGLAIADMDGDGFPEIAYDATVFSTINGAIALRWIGPLTPSSTEGLSTFANVSGGSDLQLVAGNVVYRADGSVVWQRVDLPQGFNAVADFDGDGNPDVVLVGTGQVWILEGATGVTKFGPVSLPGAGSGGPPVIADFDGDGRPEIGVATAATYLVLKPNLVTRVLSPLWQNATHDLSSSVTGSIAFDFDGSGRASVVYSDECFLWVFDGATGAVRFAASHTSFTGTEEPIVADVDGDGKAEIVMVSNGADPSAWGCLDASNTPVSLNGVTWQPGPGPGQAYRGITVFGSAGNLWAGAPVMWNQHTFHVTNVNDATNGLYPSLSYGAIPRSEVGNWSASGLNNFRQNVQRSLAATTTTLSASASPAITGQPTTFTATVAPVSDMRVPTGSVTFKDGTLSLGSQPLSGGQAALMVSSLTVGTHVITATYGGDSVFSGSSATLTEQVQSASCIGTAPAPCAPIDQCHLAGVCDQQTGFCSNPAAADGTACNDGNPCTQIDTCQAGTCVGSSTIVCTASDPCHVAGVCDVGTGMCTNPPAADKTSCDDGQFCNGQDVCFGGTCTHSGNPCQKGGVCDPTNGACVECLVGSDCKSGLCSAGVCASACPTGQVNCGGVCRDTSTDSANCGACGHVCAGGNSCVSGQCQAASSLLRVHYPAGGHAVTVRGSAGGLSWTLGQPMAASGDTFTYALVGLTAPAEWKPLLDDTTWSRGPNYHVAPGETVDVWPHFTTTQGRVVTLITAFHSMVLGNDRAIYAYLPASYDENTDATYPVVYMHDGQNLWAALPQLAFATPWNVDTTFDAAAEMGACSAGGIVGWGAQPLGGTPVTCIGDSECPSGECRTFPEAIVIGVANNTNRIFEYTPTTDPGTPGGGGADSYIQMLIGELKPTIDAMLRTRPDVGSTAIAGSSLGGLVSAYAALQRPDVYGLVAELSPSTWWNGDVIVSDVAGTLPAPARPQIVYVDSGQGTVDDQADTDLLAAQYLALGYVDGVNFRHVVQPGAAHNETYWAERFPGAMQLLLGVRGSVVGCAGAVDGTACDDGNACTQIDACRAGICVGSNTVVCAASDPCLVAGVCNSGTGLCSNPPAADGTGCDDGQFCDGKDVCFGGTCTHSGDPCQKGEVCDPKVGACVIPSCPTGQVNCGGACVDLNSNANDCGACGVVCPPGNACISARCQAASSCNDGVKNDSETAVDCGGSCPACGVGYTCLVNGDCTSKACISGVCQAAASCTDGIQDGNETGVDCGGSCPACTAGCLGDTDCNDKNPCTTDTCVSNACVHTAVVCTALDQCHSVGTCDSGTGICSNPAKANGSSCSDGNACTQFDSCQAGICAGSKMVTCTALDQCHVAGVCDPGTGACSNPVAADGSACSDGNACTTNDTCLAGTCTGGPPANCDDGNACTIDSCSPSSGCMHTPGNAGVVCRPSAGVCDAAETCTGTDATCPGDVKSTAVCRASAGVCDVAESCDGVHNDCPVDGFQSSATVCRPAVGQCDVAETCTGMSAACPTDGLAPNGTSCSDGNACTQSDTCQSGVCRSLSFAWTGVLQPINGDGTSIFKLGSTVPV
jgi:predicted alpha/beta superfamily hydrolase